LKFYLERSSTRVLAVGTLIVRVFLLTRYVHYDCWSGGILEHEL
jgi:hypothetical protein